jgi:hypothetical protein
VGALVVNGHARVERFGVLIDDGQSAGVLAVDEQLWTLKKGMLHHRRVWQERRDRWRAVFTLMNDHAEGFLDDEQRDALAAGAFEYGGVSYRVTWADEAQASRIKRQYFEDWN